MKRMVVGVTALLLVVFGSSFGSNAARAAASGVQHVEGGGIQDSTFKFAFSATRNADGKVVGHFEDTDTFSGVDQYVLGEVNCLTVRGNYADVGFIVTRSNVYLPGTEANFAVIDNGPPVGGQPRDLLSDIFGNQPVSTVDCSRHDDPYPIDSGNIVVDG